MDSTDTQIMPEKKTRAVEGESKRDRFLRLVQPRVDRALNAIRVVSLVGGANRYHYEFAQSDVDEIVQALDEAVTQLRDKLSRKPVQKKFEFGKGS